VRNSTTAEFYPWFLRYKNNLVQNCMSLPLRITKLWFRIFLTQQTWMRVWIIDWNKRLIAKTVNSLISVLYCRKWVTHKERIQKRQLLEWDHTKFEPNTWNICSLRLHGSRFLSHLAKSIYQRFSKPHWNRQSFLLIMFLLRNKLERQEQMWIQQVNIMGIW
jgi:hypothetical protein